MKTEYKGFIIEIYTIGGELTAIVKSDWNNYNSEEENKCITEKLSVRGGNNDTFTLSDVKNKIDWFLMDAVKYYVQNAFEDVVELEKTKN